MANPIDPATSLTPQVEIPPPHKRPYVEGRKQTESAWLEDFRAKLQEDADGAETDLNDDALHEMFRPPPVPQVDRNPPSKTATVTPEGKVHTNRWSTSQEDSEFVNDYLKMKSKDIPDTLLELGGKVPGHTLEFEGLAFDVGGGGEVYDLNEKLYGTLDERADLAQRVTNQMHLLDTSNAVLNNRVNWDLIEQTDPIPWSLRSEEELREGILELTQMSLVNSDSPILAGGVVERKIANGNLFNRLERVVVELGIQPEFKEIIQELFIEGSGGNPHMARLDLESMGESFGTGKAWDYIDHEGDFRDPIPINPNADPERSLGEAFYYWLVKWPQDMINATPLGKIGGIGHDALEGMQRWNEEHVEQVDENGNLITFADQSARYSMMGVTGRGPAQSTADYRRDRGVEVFMEGLADRVLGKVEIQVFMEGLADRVLGKVEEDIKLNRDELIAAFSGAWDNLKEEAGGIIRDGVVPHLHNRMVDRYIEEFKNSPEADRNKTLPEMYKMTSQVLSNTVSMLTGVHWPWLAPFPTPEEGTDTVTQTLTDNLPDRVEMAADTIVNGPAAPKEFNIPGFHENMRRMMNLNGGNFDTYADVNTFMRNLSSGDMTVGEQLYWYNQYNDNFNRLSWQLDSDTEDWAGDHRLHELRKSLSSVRNGQDRGIGTVNTSVLGWVWGSSDSKNAKLQNTPEGNALWHEATNFVNHKYVEALRAIAPSSYLRGRDLDNQRLSILPLVPPGDPNSVPIDFEAVRNGPAVERAAMIMTLIEINDLQPIGADEPANAVLSQLTRDMRKDLERLDFTIFENKDPNAVQSSIGALSTMGILLASHNGDRSATFRHQLSEQTGMSNADISLIETVLLSFKKDRPLYDITTLGITASPEELTNIVAQLSETQERLLKGTADVLSGSKKAVELKNHRAIIGYGYDPDKHGTPKEYFSHLQTEGPENAALGIGKGRVGFIGFRGLFGANGIHISHPAEADDPYSWWNPADKTWLGGSYDPKARVEATRKQIINDYNALHEHGMINLELHTAVMAEFGAAKGEMDLTPKNPDLIDGSYDTLLEYMSFTTMDGMSRLLQTQTGRTAAENIVSIHDRPVTPQQIIRATWFTQQEAPTSIMQLGSRDISIPNAAVGARAIEALGMTSFDYNNRGNWSEEVRLRQIGRASTAHSLLRWEDHSSVAGRDQIVTSLNQMLQNQQGSAGPTIAHALRKVSPQVRDDAVRQVLKEYGQALKEFGDDEMFNLTIASLLINVTAKLARDGVLQSTVGETVLTTPQGKPMFPVPKQFREGGTAAGAIRYNLVVPSYYVNPRWARADAERVSSRDRQGYADIFVRTLGSGAGNEPFLFGSMPWEWNIRLQDDIDRIKKKRVGHYYKSIAERKQTAIDIANDNYQGKVEYQGRGRETDVSSSPPATSPDPNAMLISPGSVSHHPTGSDQSQREIPAAMDILQQRNRQQWQHRSQGTGRAGGMADIRAWYPQPIADIPLGAANIPQP